LRALRIQIGNIQMTRKDRVDTLRLLIDGHRILRSSSKLTLITGELNRILASSVVPKHNGWLLSVLHTTRTLDTALSEIVTYYGWHVSQPSLGKYLAALTSNNKLWPHEKNGYLNGIVKKRNKYMHEAGAMPNQLEADLILNEMHACLSVVLARV
jgi:hypothetical protein